MRFFRRGPDSTGTPQEQAEEAERAERSRQLVEAGGIPVAAEERIAKHNQEGGVWTSDLSVDELAALRGVGYEPVAQVLGSSLYRVGWIGGWGMGPGLGGGIGVGGIYAYQSMEPQENVALTQALRDARNRALHRLLLEARGLGAEGVVGVRLAVRAWDWAQGMSEFTVLGTAVRRPGVQPPAEPFTSTLSGQDLAKLLSAGYFPTRLVMGVSAQQAVAVLGRGLGGYSAWFNQEMTPFSRAMHQAQAVATQRLRLEAGEAAASGVVGVEFTNRVIEYPTGSEAVMGRIVEWVILGTAVVPRTGSPPLPKPLQVVSLNARRMADERPGTP
ncbi:MAG: heavy metal-binding domain-containing protein [Candidatus Dormibacteria bacterium]